jgi:hypothetical protein
MSVAWTKVPPPGAALLDGDYQANDGCWVSCDGVSVRIAPKGYGVQVALYWDGHEDESLGYIGSAMAYHEDKPEGM